MKSQIETITPEQARKMLKSNVGNRRVREAWVKNLACMIADGEWKVTHQGIAFDVTGRLIDGQHRLLAIVEAGKPVMAMVTRGLSENTYKYVDGGRPRIYADRISLVSDPRDNVLANKLVWAYLCAAKQMHSQITVSLVEETFLEMSDGFLCVIPHFRKYVRRITISHVGAAIAVMCSRYKEEGNEFAHQLVSGEGLEATSPVLSLRNFLLGESSKYGTEVYWKSVAATQAFIDDRKVIRLFVATEDYAGNTYDREANARARKGLKAHVARQTNKILSATA